MEANINYLTGDATLPKTQGNKIIVHICNDVGGWGKGFVLAISRRWKEPENRYREWYDSGDNFDLGEVQFVQVEDDLWIANIIGQHQLTEDKYGNPPIRYDAVLSGLNKVGEFSLKNEATAHMPRIGCGLAGGSWDRIEPLIVESLTVRCIETFVYDYP